MLMFLDFRFELSFKVLLKTRTEHLKQVNALSSNPHLATQPLSWVQAGAYLINVPGADS